MRTALVVLSILFAPSLAAAEVADVHDTWNALVQRYVVDERWVDYSAWHASEEDLQTLTEVVEAYESVDPSTLTDDQKVAFWLNVYNAATVELVLEHYPVDSIKDIGGLIGSPWGMERVTVAGETLTLDQIQHDKLDPVAQDARVHFALNCASVGCPPLAPFAFTGDAIDEQLDRVARRAVTDPEWVDLTGCTGTYGDGTIRLTKIFDWYRDDFGGDEGVREFLARYRPDDAFRLRNTSCSLDFSGYDWNLNAPPASRS
ncbi:MAG TPA: DUF547 domain-containing protein [Candidatus Krumholzibacteria bacterium]|nr:DUF547 domain-containing protein [Candidatus Krumholzibacteria bacterium]